MKPFTEIYGSLLGTPCWNAKLGHGSFLTFEFGNPHLEIRETQESSEKVIENAQRRLVSILGEWRLWIYCCNWRIFQHEDLLAHSESDRGQMTRAVEKLDGQALKNIRLNPQNGSTIFEFDLGGMLRTAPYTSQLSENDEQWFLFDCSGYVLTLYANREFSYERANKSQERE